MSDTLTTKSDGELMKAYIEGDSGAFETLYRRYSPRVHGFFRRAFTDAGTAEDLLQYTFLKFHRARASFRQEEALGGWLFRIAYNLFRDELRRRGRRPVVPVDPVTLAETVHSPDEVKLPDDRVGRVRGAVDELPEAQREAILLCKYMELSHAEAARVAKCSPDAMKLRVFRALQSLRTRLTKQTRREKFIVGTV